MLSSNKSDYVIKLVAKDNIDNSNTYPINKSIITNDNTDQFYIDDILIKEMAKIVYDELIKLKKISQS